MNHKFYITICNECTPLYFRLNKTIENANALLSPSNHPPSAHLFQLNAFDSEPALPAL
jgi:hypothetical protein